MHTRIRGGAAGRRVFGTAWIYFAIVALSVISSDAFGAVSRPDGLVGWYRAENNAKDAAISGAFGVDFPAGTYAAGHVGQGFSFNTLNSRMTMNFEQGYRNQEFTLEAWIQRASATDAGFNAGKFGMIMAYGAGGYGLGMWGAGNSSARPNGELFVTRVGVSQVNTAVTITDIDFHHVAVTKIDGVVYVYLDGVPRASLAYNPTFTFTPPFAIGNRPDSDDAFRGVVDEASIYSRALGFAEIAGIYADGTEGKATSVVTIAASKSASGGVVLRDAIESANTQAGTDKIGFAIPSPPVGELDRYSFESNLVDSIGTADGTPLGGINGVIEGIAGWSLGFDGIDDGISFPHQADQNRGHNLSISAWISQNSNGVGRTILQKRTGAGAGGFALDTTSVNSLTFNLQIGGSFQTLFTPDNAIGVGGWNHVVATYDGAAMRIYVDGEEAASRAQTGDIDESAADMVAGFNVPNPFFAFDGRIDELALYARALEPSEVRALYQFTQALEDPFPPDTKAVYYAERNGSDSFLVSNGAEANGAGYADGPFQKAFSFDGVNDYVEVPAQTWGFSTDCTVTAWVKTADANGAIVSISHGSDQDELFLGLAGGSALIGNVKDRNNFNYRVSNTPINGGEWVFVAGELDHGGAQANLRIFVNGVEQAGVSGKVGAATNISDATARTLRIGWRRTQFAGEALNGLADSVMVFGRSLEPNEIKALYDTGLAAMRVPKTIEVGWDGSGGLPGITQQAVIDGYTQLASRANTNPFGMGLNTVPLIELDGNNNIASGLRIQPPAQECVIRGLVIDRFQGRQVYVTGPGGNRIQGNFIGTDPTGASLREIANSVDLGHGIQVEESGLNEIGAETPAARNLISGLRVGIHIFNSTGGADSIWGNIVGLDGSGTVALGRPGTMTGIFLDNTQNIHIGDSGPGAGNVVSGTPGIPVAGGNGIVIEQSGFTTVSGNYIGTRADGTGNLGNFGKGILLNSSSDNVIGGAISGSGNRIANNGFSGVHVIEVNDADRNSIYGNSIYNNGGLGIDLGEPGITPTPILPRRRGVEGGTDANNLQTYPLLTDVKSTSTLKISGTLANSTPNTEYFIDFYASPTADPTGYGEGRDYLGFTQVTTTGAGTATFSQWFPFVSRNFAITATATDFPGNTSEFSAAIAVPGDNAAEAAWRRYP